MMKRLLFFGIIAGLFARAEIPGTVGVSGPIAPQSATDEYPVGESKWMKVDFRVGPNAAARTSITSPDGIPTLRQVAGMLFYQLDNHHVYRLESVGGAWTDLGVFNEASAPPTIYSANGTLVADRVLSGAGFNLAFSGIGQLNLSSVTTALMSSATVLIDGTTTVNINSLGANGFKFPASNPSLVPGTDTILVYDPVTKNVKKSSTTLAALAPVNVYNTSGTLTGNRNINAGGFDFQVLNGANVNLTGNTASLLANTDATIGATTKATVQGGTSTEIVAPTVSINPLTRKYAFKATPSTAVGTDELMARDPVSGEVRTVSTARIQDITASTSLYSANGTLQADRVVTGNAKDLSFNNLDVFSMVSVSENHTQSSDFGVLAPQIGMFASTQLTIAPPSVSALTAEAGQVLRAQSAGGIVDYATLFYVGSGVQTADTYNFSNSNLAPDYDSATQHPEGTIAYVKFDLDGVGNDKVVLGPNVAALALKHHDGTGTLPGEIKAGRYYQIVRSGTAGSSVWTILGATADSTARYKNDESVKYVDTLAAMVALDPAYTKEVLTRGYWALGDGGGARYRWEATGTASLGTVVASGVSGYWKLIHGDSINVRIFGAKGDATIGWKQNVGGTPVPTDDAAAFQAAVNYCGDKGVKLIIPNGRYWIGSTIVNRSATGVWIQGQNENHALTAQHTAGTDTPQTELIRNGNYTLFRFAGPLTAGDLTSGFYTQNWQKGVQVHNLLFEDTAAANATTAPFFQLKRSVLSRWTQVSFIGINSTVHDLWNADDFIFTDCRWLSCGFGNKPSVVLHRNETDGSEPIYAVNNTGTFTDCVWEYGYNSAVWVPRTGIGDIGNINFNHSQFKQHRPIIPVPIVDLYRADGVNFNDTLVVFGTDNIVSAQSLSAFVWLESCRANGRLSVNQITHSGLCTVDNAVRIIDPRGGSLNIDVSSDQTATIAGNVLVKVTSDTFSKFQFILTGKSYINNALDSSGAFGGKPLSNWPTGEFGNNAEDHLKRLTGVSMNGAYFYTAALSSTTIGTGDFTITTETEVPSTAGNYGIWILGDSAASPPIATASSLSLYWDAGLLKLRYVNGSSVATVLASQEQLLQSIYARRVVPIAVVRRSGNFEIWFDNARLELTGTQPLVTDAIAASSKLTVGVAYNGASIYSRQLLSSASFFTYAMQFADILSYRNFGVGGNDKWVDKTTGTINIPFATTTESFTAEGTGSLTATGAGEVTWTSGAGATKIVRTALVSAKLSKPHRLSIRIKLTSGTASPLVLGYRASSSTDTSTNSSITFTPTGTYAWYTGVVGTEKQLFSALRLGTESGNSAVYTIDQILVEQLGALSHWDFREGNVTANDLANNYDMKGVLSNPVESTPFVLTRMTTTERTSMPITPAGLMVYDTTLNQVFVFTTVWRSITFN